MVRWLFVGDVGSRTDLPGRGKGLPKIARAHADGEIKRLVVLSNRVYANFETKEFRKLNEEFSGTLLYWEIEP